MATQLQLRRGTNTQMASFTGAEGELAINTTNDSAHVHDGSTAGGHELARADFNNISASATLTLGTLNTTNLDLTNLEVTNIKAKDGTAAGSIADSTGVVTITSAVLTTVDITTLKIGSTTVTATATELNYVDGVTSAIQTQIDAKLPLAGGTLTGALTISGSVTAGGLTVETATDPASITLRNTGNTSGFILKNFNGNEAQLVNVDNGPFVFKTNDAEAMRIDSSGNVGIAQTPSGNHKLEITQSGGDGINVNSGADYGGIRLTDNSHSFAIRNYANNLLIYDVTNTQQRVTLDDSGVFMVAKSTSSSNNVGFETSQTGNTSITRSGGQPLLLNRQTDDGDIVLFRKDGTSIGSIQSRAGVVTTIVLNPASGNGAGLSGGTKAVVPADEAGIIDNDISLGVSSHRFKDLYLSGGVFLGGTGSANELSGYEEGTWTPTFTGGSSNPTVSYSSQSGSYTKVGRIVTVQVYVQSSAFSGGSGDLQISGLPFASITPHCSVQSEYIGITMPSDANNVITRLNPSSSAFSLEFLDTREGNTITNRGSVSVSSASSPVRLIATFTYMTS